MHQIGCVSFPCSLAQSADICTAHGHGRSSNDDESRKQQYARKHADREYQRIDHPLSSNCGLLLLWPESGTLPLFHSDHIFHAALTSTANELFASCGHPKTILRHVLNLKRSQNLNLSDKATVSTTETADFACLLHVSSTE